MTPEPILRKLETAGEDRKDVFDDSNLAMDAAAPITGLIVRHGSYVDAIAVRYGDEQPPQHGGDGGSADVIQFREGDYLVRVSGTFKNPYGAGTVITMIKFETKQGFIYGPYCSTNGTPFEFVANEGEQVWSFHGSTGRYDIGTRVVVLTSLGVTMIPTDENPWTVPKTGNAQANTALEDLNSCREQLKKSNWEKWENHAIYDRGQASWGYLGPGTFGLNNHIQTLDSEGIQTWIDCFQYMQRNPEGWNKDRNVLRKAFALWLSQIPMRDNTMQSLFEFLSPPGEQSNILLKEILQDLNRRKVAVGLKNELERTKTDLNDIIKDRDQTIANNKRQYVEDVQKEQGRTATANDKIKIIQGKLDTSKNDITKTKEILKITKKELSNKEKNLDTANDKIKTLQGRLDNSTNDVTRLKKELNDANKKGIELDKEIQTLKKDLNDANQKGIELDKEIQTLKKDLNIANDKIKTLQGKLDTSKKELTKTKEILKTTKKDLSDKEKNLGTANDKIKTLQEKLENAVNDVTRLKKELDDANKKGIELDREIQTLKKKLDAANEEIKIRQKKLDASEKELAETNINLGQASDEIERLDGVVKTLQKNLETANETIKNKDKTIADNKKEYDLDIQKEQGKTAIELRKWQLIQDKDLLAMLPLDNFTEKGLMDFSGNDQKFFITKDSTHLNGSSIKVGELKKGLTLEIWINCSNSKSLESLNLVTLTVGGVTFSMGIKDILNGQMYVCAGEDHKQLDYLSENNFIPRSEWAPWIFLLEPKKGQQPTEFVPSFYGSSSNTGTTVQEFEGHNKNNPHEPKDALHKITGLISLSETIDNLDVQIALPESSNNVFQIKNLRIYRRALSITEIQKTLTHERPDA